MVDRRTKRQRSLAGFGVFLILAGLSFLLIRLDVFDYRFWWRDWWPLILVAIGFCRIVVPSRPKQIASGLNMILIGLWFFACMRHWYGLTYRTAWPLLIVLVGLEMVLTSILERIWPNWKEEEHHA